ncbi:MAG: lipopolysaccharide biosynthesis protein [Desulfuromonadaceae bacterium]|nr:lipopolysaccharide biosynthesis protein [Desulfuromonadaceae bacterium]
MMDNMDNNQQKETTVQDSYVADDEINLLEYLLVLAKNWRTIVAVCGVTFVLACGVTLLMPNIYTATTRIMPPSESKGGLASMLGGMSDLAALAGVSAGGGSGDLYVAMLKSRSVSDAIIDRFDLMNVYEQDYRVKMYVKLSKLVDVSLGKKDGMIAVSVEDEKPERAADIANAFVEELQKLNLQLNLNSAGRQRVFLEQRLKLVKAELVKAEEALRDFQIANKAIKIDAQATATIEAFGRIKGEIASKEVELGVAQSFQTEQNFEVKALRESIAALKEQLRRLEQSPDGKKVSGDVFIATADVPEIGLQYARLLRDFKIQETLFELLTRQYEMAKIEESKNTSTIQVLDQAVPPDRKSKPKRALMVLAVTFVAGFMAVLFAFIREYGGRMSADDRMLWDEIKGRLSLRRAGKKQ